MRSRCVLASSTGDSFFAAMSRAASAMVRIADISLLHVEGQRGLGFARQRRVHARDQALEDHGAGQEFLHLIGRQVEAGPLQNGVELGFVDRGRAHGHSFRVQE